MTAITYDENKLKDATALAVECGLSPEKFKHDFEQYVEHADRAHTPNDYLDQYIKKVSAYLAPYKDKGIATPTEGQTIKKWIEHYGSFYTENDRAIYELLKRTRGEITNEEDRKELPKLLDRCFSRHFKIDFLDFTRNEYPQFWFSPDASYENIKKHVKDKIVQHQKGQPHVYYAVKQVLLANNAFRFKQGLDTDYSKPVDAEEYAVGVKEIVRELRATYKRSKIDKSFELENEHTAEEFMRVFLHLEMAEDKPRNVRIKKSDVKMIVENYLDDLNAVKGSTNEKEGIQRARYRATYALWNGMEYDRDLHDIYTVSEAIEKKFKLGKYEHPEKEKFGRKYQSEIAAGLIVGGASLAAMSQNHYKDDRGRPREKMGFWGKVGVALCVVGGLLVVDRVMNKPMMKVAEQVFSKAKESLGRL